MSVDKLGVLVSSRLVYSKRDDFVSIVRPPKSHQAIRRLNCQDGTVLAPLHPRNQTPIGSIRIDFNLEVSRSRTAVERIPKMDLRWLEGIRFKCVSDRINCRQNFAIGMKRRAVTVEFRPVECECKGVEF